MQEDGSEHESGPRLVPEQTLQGEEGPDESRGNGGTASLSEHVNGEFMEVFSKNVTVTIVTYYVIKARYTASLQCYTELLYS